MRTLLISMGIGVVAGIVDILPMMAHKMKARAIISAFLQYFFVSIVILNISLFGIPWWLKGSIVSFALSLPVAIMVSGNEKSSAPIILVMSIVLGGLIGLAGHFIK